jgi:hypothetical protein
LCSTLTKPSKKEIGIFDIKKTHFRIQNSAESGRMMEKMLRIPTGSGFPRIQNFLQGYGYGSGTQGSGSSSGSGNGLKSYQKSSKLLAI